MKPDESQSPSTSIPSKGQKKSKKKIIIGSIAGLLLLGGVAGATNPEPDPSTPTQNIVQQSRQESIKKIEKKTRLIDFEVTEEADSARPKGERHTVSEGVKGEHVDTYEVSYMDGKETSRKLVDSGIAKQPVNQVVRVGTYVAPAAPRPAQTYTQPAQSRSVQQDSSVYYKNCTAARNAGVTPIYRGQPGYASHLDRDNDGIACE